MTEFRLLGPVDLVVAGRSVDLGPYKQRGIIAALLAEPNRLISTDTLVARVWDNPPETVRHSVYTYMARIRRILRSATADTADPIEIRSSRGGYLLDVGPERVDLSGFRALITRARVADDQTRAATLAEALQMWRGDPLAGLDSAWARSFRSGLRQLRHEALVDWADVQLRLGHPKVVAADLWKALMDDPLAEDLHERLIKAYYLDNRVAEALSHFDRMRRTFAAELGVDPGPRLRELHRVLLRGESAPVEPAAPPTREVPSAEAPDFRGREVDLAAVRQALTADHGRSSKPVLITGGPGIGKSALAIRAARTLRAHYPDGVLYADLGGCSDQPAEPSEVLYRLLRELQVAPADIPANFYARAGRYHDLMAGRRMLVILDDAATTTQIAPVLAVGAHSATLVTSRNYLSPRGVRTIVLRELSAADSVGVLAALVGTERVRAEPWPASTIARCCSGIPMALRAVAARLAAHPRWTLTEQLGLMSDEDQRYRQFSYGDLDIRRSIDATVSRLSPDAARVLHFLGATLTPRELVTTLAVPGLTTEQNAAALAELAAAHLLSIHEQSDGNRGYLMLEVHRLHAKLDAPLPV
ncbi:BTAD domain-containing putative transcriptional regulator [Nocardia sp. NPDC051832]|uniref:AfsR/SARP family transcriptional regulator n=1 Tax=Nocardia sp. NPDC051832 TaxID=3155673 RepID=UPI003431DF0B